MTEERAAPRQEPGPSPGSGPEARPARTPTPAPAPGTGTEPDGGVYDAATSAFVERFAADMTEAGMQRMAARVFACLLASDDGSLSSAQLADRLRISPAAVSGAVRYLAQVHMVSREREPGSRRELYRLHENVWYEAILDREQLITRWTTTLRTGEQALGADTRAGRRVRDTHDFLEFMQSEVEGMLERWRAHRRARLKQEE